MTLRVGLIRASLPSYFPQKHRVWEVCEAALAEVCDAAGAELFVVPEMPMDLREARKAVDQCRAEAADFLLLLHGGFSMGDVAREIAASGLPMGAWAVPEPTLEADIQLNNFVSLNMTLSIARGVRDLKTQPVQWYFGAADDPALRARLETTFRALGMRKALDGARIGMVGGLAPTFYNMAVDEAALRRALGVEVEAQEIVALTGRMAAVDEGRVTAELAAMRAAARVDGVSEAQMLLAARAALGLRDLADAGGYDALAVSDWPALQVDPGMHPGAAFTWVEERDGLPVAPEGDILGAVTQLAARALTGRVGYLLDMTEPDAAHGDLLVWHGGGGPLYLADDGGARWINHPMIGRGTPEGACYGAISDLVFRDGPASVLRIGRDGRSLFAMEAEVKGRAPSGFTGCRGWLRDFRIGAEAATLDDVVTTVMTHGIEHHFVLVPGHFRAVLAEFAVWSGLEPLCRVAAADHLIAAP